MSVEELSEGSSHRMTVGGPLAVVHNKCIEALGHENCTYLPFFSDCENTMCGLHYSMYSYCLVKQEEF